MRRTRAILAMWVALGALGLTACGTRRAENVLLVTIDTLRPDHLGAYGDPDARTPHLDALARSGAQFENVRVPYPLTLPSHASLLTGRLPYRHDARRNDSFAFDTALPSLPAAFAETGSATGAVVSTFVLNRGFGLAESFGTYVDLADPTDPRRGRNERRARETTRLAADWLDARPDSTFFLWTHYFDPHDDYEPPPPWNAVFAGEEIDLYDGEIAYTDRELGRLLRRLEQRRHADRLLVVVTSDHGEAFGEHAEVGHGYFLYDTTVRVPLLVSWPSRRGHTWIHRTPVRSLDVFPTVCRLAGVPVPDELPGIDLDPFGDGPSASPPLYLETFEPTVAYGATDLRAVVRDEWKFIEAPRPELYGLEADPDELDNRVGTEDDERDALEEILAGHRERERAHREERGSDGEREVDEETRARLLALGYVTGDADEDAATAWSRRDPKDLVHLIPRMYAGIRDCREGRMEQGLKTLSEVLEEDPINAKALHWISEARMSAGDSLGALDVYRDALAYDPRNTDILNQIGVLGLRMKRPDDAVAALEAVVEIDPLYVAGWLNLASAYMMARQPRKARAAVEKALHVDPTNPATQRIAERLGIPPPQSR